MIFVRKTFKQNREGTVGGNLSNYFGSFLQSHHRNNRIFIVSGIDFGWHQIKVSWPNKMGSCFKTHSPKNSRERFPNTPKNPKHISNNPQQKSPKTSSPRKASPPQKKPSQSRPQQKHFPIEKKRRGTWFFLTVNLMPGDGGLVFLPFVRFNDFQVAPGVLTTWCVVLNWTWKVFVGKNGDANWGNLGNLVWGDFFLILGGKLSYARIDDLYMDSSRWGPSSSK